MWSRLPTIALSIVLLLAAGAPHAMADKVLVGAIRWDAWYGAPTGNYGIVGRTVNADLSPSRWHYRLPFFAQVLGPNNVSINGDNDATMDAEEAYAREYGIDYWAFCTYPIGCRDYNPPDSQCPYIQCCADNYALSYALLRYLSKPRTVGFSLILQNNWFPGCDHGSNETLDQEVARYVSYFRLPNYQRVTAANRPIVYLFGGDPKVNGPALAALHNATINAGLPPPYYVYMGGDAQSGAAAAASLNASAISNYVSVRDWGSAAAPFDLNMQFEKQYWADALRIGVDIVPPVTAGWDPRPRFDYPVPWGPPQPQCGPVGDEKCYTQDPTMDQLTNITAAAISFTLANPQVTPARSVLISAWNEHDEGHWVEPSLQDGPVKLEAIRKGIAAGAAVHQARV